MVCTIVNAAVHGAAVMVYIIMIVLIFILIYIVCKRRSLRSKTHVEGGTHKSQRLTFKLIYIIVIDLCFKIMVFSQNSRL